MAKIDDTIEKIKKELKQAQERKKKMQARTLSAELKSQRSKDTRKKILLGAFLMERMEKNPDYAAKVMLGFGDYLKRDDDRALFGLAPLPVADPVSA